MCCVFFINMNTQLVKFPALKSHAVPLSLCYSIHTEIINHNDSQNVCLQLSYCRRISYSLHICLCVCVRVCADEHALLGRWGPICMYFYMCMSSKNSHSRAGERWGAFRSGRLSWNNRGKENVDGPLQHVKCFLCFWPRSFCGWN